MPAAETQTGESRTGDTQTVETQAADIPLLAAQAAIWYAQALDPASPVYNTGDAVEIAGPLDEDRFERALRQAVAEAQVLSAVVVIGADGTPRQRPRPDGRWPLHRLDLRAATDSADEADSADETVTPEAAAEAWMRADLARPADLAEGPLFTHALIRLADDRWTWYRRIHHLAVDAYALTLLGERVAELYRAHTTGTEPAPSPFAGLAEAAAEEAAYREGEEYRTDRAHWAARMADADAPATLPGTPDPGPARDTPAPLRLTAVLPAGTRDRLERAATAVRATWAELLLAATAGYLHRLSGSRDVVLGLPLANRRGPAALRTPVAAANVLPLRLAVGPADSAEGLLRHVVRELRAVRRHQRYPLEDLRRDLGRTGDRRALFGPMVNIKAFEGDLDLAGLPGTVRNLAAGPVDDLALNVSPGPDGALRLVIDADPARYDAATLTGHRDGLLRYLDALAELLLTAPHTPIARIDLLDADGLRRATAGRTEPPAERTVPELFAAQAARTPEAVAVRCGATALTYGQLDAAADRLARRLAALGVRGGAPVAIALPRGADTLVAMLAVLKAGGACVSLDLTHPAQRLAAVLADARPVCAVGTAEALAGLDLPAGLPTVRPAEAEDEPGGERPAEPTTAPSAPELHHPAYVLHTSGSTGRPKGVVVTHASLANLHAGLAEDHIAPAVRRTGRERLRVAHSASFAFDASWDPVLWMVHGHELHLLDDATYRDPAALAAHLHRERIDYLDLTPSYLEVLLAEGILDEGRHRPSVLVVGGEATPPALWQRLTAVPGLHPVDLYGPTETTVDAYAWTPGPDGAPVGRVVRGSRAYVLDGSLRPAPDGATGELYVAGACLARGYLGRPDLTAERFLADPFGPPGTRMYCTGDLARRRSDGTLEFLGRADDQVKIRGFRVEPGEIAAVLAELPGVAQAVVIARPGPQGRRLLGYAVPVPGEAPDPDGLRAALAARLPAHMVPAAVLLLAELPRTAHDKLDHRALPEPAVVAEGAAAATPQEELVCGLLADVLGLPRAPGRDASFFDLGGHSLLAGRLAARLRETFAVPVGFADVFRHPTAAGLAALLGERAGAGSATEPDIVADTTAEPAAIPAPAPVPVPRAERMPLSPAQRGLWFLHRLEGPSPTYNIPLVLTLTGPLDRPALTRALGDLVARHEVLRTVYGEEPDGTPYQRILPAMPLAPLAPVELHDGRGEMAEAVRYAFDLTAEPPLRATLFADGPDRHTLLILLHHIAGDGASTTPLVRDLAAAYAARLAGAAPELPPLTVQFADHAAWQRARLGTTDAPSPLAVRQTEYWCTALAGLPDQLELPADRPRPAVAGHQGATVPFTLDAEAHAALVALARAADSTVFMAVLAGLAALLGRHGCGTDIPVGTPVAGREDDETAALVGYFVNSVVLRTDLSGAPTFKDLLARVRATVLDAHEHADLPFDRLVEELNPARSLARHPLFQVMLAWQSRPDEPTAFGGGLTAEITAIPSGTAKFDLTLNAGELPDGGIGGFLEYRTDLFDAATVAALGERLARLLAAAATAPDTPVDRLPLISARERERALVEWNAAPDSARPVVTPPGATQPDVTLSGATLAELFEAAAEANPHAPAVSYEGSSLDYTELGARADRLARLLAAHGIGPGTIVALALPRSLELVVALLAVTKSGAAYLPLDPDYPADRLAYMLADATPAALLTDRATDPRLPAHEVPRILVDGPEAERYPAVPLAQHERIRPLRAEDTAYVIYTSGSTGRPKGVSVTHHNVVRLFTATDHWFGFGAEDVWTLFHSYAFDFSVWELWGALLHGGRLVVVPHLVSRDPAAFLDLLARERVTVLNQTPSAFYQLSAADRDRPGRELALRHVVFGGEALELGRLDDWYSRHAEDAPTLVNMYGITETTVHVSYIALDRASAAAGSSSTIGVNIPDLRVYVLDRYLQPVPPGVTGEMYVAGAGLARGYLGRPELTATRFVADPYAELFGEHGTRMYRSGDLARRRADGVLEYFGRADQQVKLRGFRIELGEIEAVLAAHPAVADAAVTVREDVPGDKRLVAYAVASGAGADSGAAAAPQPSGLHTDAPQPAAPQPEDLRAHAAAELPVHMVPSAVVLLDRLPLTANGKLDRRALPAPEAPAAGAGRPPRTPREQQLCELFAEVLGVAAVGVEDDFFALGGHSLLVVRLAGRIREVLGLEVGIGALFQAPTVAALDAALTAGSPDTDALDVLLPLRPVAPGRQRPLFAVHPAGGLSWCYTGLIRHLPGEVPIYGLQAQGVGAATAARPLPGTMEELAAHYADRLREVQPEGPYRLLGWSTGGIIAHAVAVRLQELGQDVELLAILDAYPAEGFRELPVPDQAEALEALLTMGGFGPEDLAGRPLELDAVTELLRREGSPLAGLDDTTVAALNRIYLNTNLLVRGYDHRRYDGDVLFFRATVDTIDDTLVPELWTPYVSGRIANTDVACSHKDMTLPAPIAHIAAVIADHLENSSDE
ncbi:dimodular nonribosomal peptide synthase [Kitasatospora xanthocidica]|uniref:amino acid adenylation domain-containing protein n=1 Tax=Kitasatospora xanthocidica TaxID=83382 RepID=UPI00167B59A4|nr:non-ribosomal peptide synthetase [Kitasatospora xanthocidica]GHF34910.1 dimodular nonribosomal peptide synthase [Kitasatospora xanthocidica]